MRFPPNLRTTIGYMAAVVFGSTAILMSVMNNKTSSQIREPIPTTHVVLIGASIGQAWRLAEWPERVKAQNFTAESIPAWQFDKTEVVDEVLMRPKRKFHPTRTYLRSLFLPSPRKPDIVILKECSSYFPGDLKHYQRDIQDWVNRLQQEQILVILATVVPVTKTRAEQSPGKQESLVRYNDWVREYAQQHGLGVLDLEAALRTGDRERYLQDEYAIPDGSHLNPAAYAVLDKELQRLLVGIASKDAKQAPAMAVVQ